jgi:HK97 gp10 family phage protein
LRNSITYQVDTEEGAVYVGTNVEYAAYVELGTSKSRAYPYLRPAAENHSSEYSQIIESELKGQN